MSCAANWISAAPEMLPPLPELAARRVPGFDDLPLYRPLSRTSRFAMAMADKSGTLFPSEGEKDGVKGALACSGGQWSHKVRRIVSRA